ncbi:MAG: hypothetical protein ABH864_03790 [archaeon]
MMNKRGFLGFLGVLVLLIIGVAIGALAVSIWSDSSSSNSYSSGYDTYDSGYEDYDSYDYDRNYQDVGYDNYGADQGFQDYYSDTPDEYVDNRRSNCGYLNELCCEGTIERDPWGGIYMANRCFDDLECRGGYCVEGPEYEAYGRP